MSADLEAQIKAIADVAYEQTSPVRIDEHQSGVASDADPSPRRWWMLAAACILVVGLVGALALILRSGDGAPEPAVELGADDDTDSLRFAEPLADDTVAFFDDPSLPAPMIEPPVLPSGAPGVDSSADGAPNSIGIVVMDGATLVMRGSVVDVPGGVEVTGPPVEVGVAGARFVDDDEGAIVVPVADGQRVIAPSEFFSFGGGGPFIPPETLADLAAGVGDGPIDRVGDLDGVYVVEATIDGERSGVLTDVVTVAQGRPGAATTVNTMIVRLASTPTEQELLAVGHALTQGRLDAAALGDVTLTAGVDTLLELVSPVDLLIVNGAGSVPNLETLRFVPRSELE